MFNYLVPIDIMLINIFYYLPIIYNELNLNSNVQNINITEISNTFTDRNDKHIIIIIRNTFN